MKILLSLAGVILLASACSKQDNKVIARVGAEKITEAYLQDKFAEISPAAHAKSQVAALHWASRINADPDQ